MGIAGNSSLDAHVLHNIATHCDDATLPLCLM